MHTMLSAFGQPPTIGKGDVPMAIAKSGNYAFCRYKSNLCVL